MSKLMKSFVLAGFLGASFAAAADAATFELTESGCIVGACGEYALQNNSTDINVFGFIVGNSETRSTDENWDYWDSMVITASQWNSGLQLEMFTPGEPDIVLDTSLLSPFATYFGSDTAANAYWVDSYIGASDPVTGYIAPGASKNGFFWYDSPPASEFVVLGGGGTNDIAFSSIGTSPVPLPATAWLIIGALGGFGFLVGTRRRRRGAFA